MNSQSTLYDTQREGVPLFASKKKLDEMGHLHLLLDEMGLDEMGLDEMGLDEMGINLPDFTDISEEVSLLCL